MKRRDFIALAGATATAVALPCLAFGQAAKVPRVVIATAIVGDTLIVQSNRVKEGLAFLGWVDGKNISVEVMSDPNTVGAAAQAVASRPDVIVVIGLGPLGFPIYKAATPPIPIVFTNSSDPVAAGFVSSLARPGGNFTGNFAQDTTSKKLQYLKQLVPNLKRFAYVPYNPAAPQTLPAVVRDAATALGLEPVIFDLYKDTDLATLYDGIVAAGLTAAYNSGIAPNPDLMFDLANKNKIAVIANGRYAPLLPGERHTNGLPGNVLMYGPDIDEMLLRSASFVDAILKGAKPGDLSVEGATKFRLTVNLDAARKVGVIIPPSMLIEADEIIDYDVHAPKAGTK